MRKEGGYTRVGGRRVYQGGRRENYPALWPYVTLGIIRSRPEYPPSWVHLDLMVTTRRLHGGMAVHGDRALGSDLGLIMRICGNYTLVLTFL